MEGLLHILAQVLRYAALFVGGIWAWELCHKQTQPKGHKRAPVARSLQVQKDGNACSDGNPCSEAEASFSTAFSSHGYGYGLDGSALLRWRQEQFPQLSTLTYLDHAAATLAAKQQLQDSQQEQLQHLWANPHSQLPPGLDHSSTAIEELRQLTLRMLQAPAEEYEVVFTGGATAALKLVGETFPWTPGYSSCAHLTINHNSALGIRQQAQAAGATVCAVKLEQLQQCKQTAGPLQCQCSNPLHDQQGASYSLFVVPAECNMSGTRYDCVQLFQQWQALLQDTQLHVPAEQQQQLQQSGPEQAPPQQKLQQWLLLVDAAKACADSPPDCSRCDIDMLVLSYYKIFGYPTGLGALVVRRSLLPVLQQHKAYFGGGTVEVVLPDRPHVVRRAGAAGLEDGTLPFTAIAAARHGFRQLQRLRGWPAISHHTACLTWHLMQQLMQLKHSNGQPAAVLYCCPDVHQLLQQHANIGPLEDRPMSYAGSRHGSSSSGRGKGVSLTAPEPAVLSRFSELQGPVVCFNLLRPDGSWVGHKEVGKLAAINHICLRTGCFCNPGACAAHLGLTSQQLLSHHAAGHVCGDDHDIINGQPTGTVRASFGYMSTASDVEVLLRFLHSFFVNTMAGLASSSTTGVVVTPDTAAAAAAAGSAGAAAAVGQGVTPLKSDSSNPPLPASATPGTFQYSSTAGNGLSTAPAGAAGPATAVQRATFGADSAGGSAASCAVGRLSGLYLYPVKSCAPQQASEWPLGPNGLLYDREWAVCGPDGQVLTQKRAPRLTQVRAEVDLQQQVLRLTAAGVEQQLLVPLAQAELQGAAQSQGPEGLVGPRQQQQQQQVRVCGDQVCAVVPAGQVVGAITQPAATAAAAVDSAANAARSSTAMDSSRPMASCSSPAAEAAVAAAPAEDGMRQWFTAAVGVPCTLVRQVGSSRKVKQQQRQPGSQGSQGPPSAQTLGFANEGQYLLVNQASVDYVASRLDANGAAATSSLQEPAAGSQVAAVDALRFRPNLVVSGFDAWAEDAWAGVLINPPPADAAAAADGHVPEQSGGGAVGDSIAGADACLDAPDSKQLGHSQQQQQHHHNHQPPQQHQREPTWGSSSRSTGQQSAAASQHAASQWQPRQQQQQQVTNTDQTGMVALQVVGACGRCDMVSIDQHTGQRQGSQLLSLLAKERRVGGKLQFGVLMAHNGDSAGSATEGVLQWLRVGDPVVALL